MYRLRVDPLATKGTAEHRVLWLEPSRSEEAFEARSAERVPTWRGHRHSCVTVKLQETDWTLAGCKIVHGPVQIQVLQDHYSSIGRCDLQTHSSKITFQPSNLRMRLSSCFTVLMICVCAATCLLLLPIYRHDEVTLQLYRVASQQPSARHHFKETEGVLCIPPFQLWQMEEAQLGCTGPCCRSGQCYHPTEEPVSHVLCMLRNTK